MKYTVCILALASVAFGVTIQERNGSWQLETYGM